MGRNSLIWSTLGAPFLCLALQTPVVAFSPDPAPKVWFGCYIKNDRVGSCVITTRPVVSHGLAALRSDSHTAATINVFGARVTQEIDEMDVYLPDGSPLSSEMTISSGNRKNRVAAQFTPQQVNCTMSGNYRKVLPIPAGMRLQSPAASAVRVDRARLKQGARWTEYGFDLQTQVIEKETLLTTRGPGPGEWSIDVDSISGKMQFLIDGEGRVLRADSPPGLSLRRENQAAATHLAGRSTDLAALVSVDGGVQLPEPRTVSALELVLSDVPDDFEIPDGSGQHALRLSRGRWRVRITRSTEPKSNVRRAGRAPAGMLDSTTEINASNPEIVARAKQILGAERRTRRRIRLLHDWVHLHMRARYDIGVLRTGVDVLRDRSGVCRDYAVLYASLARAAGIPTRICSGLVYQGGRFYYHAWAESLDGDWLRVDPTRPEESVDATHITFARGDARALLYAAGLAGVVKIHVSRFRTGGAMSSQSTSTSKSPQGTGVG